MLNLLVFFWALIGDNIVWGTGAHKLESTVVILD